jgi:hypothetical protein
VLSREERLERVSLALGGLLQAEGRECGARNLGKKRDADRAFVHLY